MKEFVTAVVDDIGEVDEEDAITFVHDGREVIFYKPESGQLAVMMGMAGRDMSPETAGMFIELMFGLMEKETQRYFRTRLLDREDRAFGLETEGGLFDVFKGLTEEWSARPTKEPSDFRSSRRATGKQSTAPSRAKASTSSPSRVRASSQ